MAEARRSLTVSVVSAEREIWSGTATQVVARTNVGDHRHMTAVKGQAFTQHAAACGFQHSRVHIRVHQHTAGAARSAAVAGVKLQAIHINAVGVGHAHAQAMRAQQVGAQTHGGGFAVGAGDGDQGDAAIFAVGKHGVDDGAADIAALAKRGLQMHAQSWRGIHFHNAAVLLFQRLEHRLDHHVHTAHIQPDHLRGHHRT